MPNALRALSSPTTLAMPNISAIPFYSRNTGVKGIPSQNGQHKRSQDSYFIGSFRACMLRVAVFQPKA